MACCSVLPFYLAQVFHQRIKNKLWGEEETSSVCCRYLIALCWFA